MQSLLRILFLGVPAAAGVGLAVSVAMHTDPATRPGGSADTLSPPRIEIPAAAAPSPPVARNWPPSPGGPRFAPYHPAVTQQIAEAKVASESAQHASEQAKQVTEAYQHVNSELFRLLDKTLLTQASPTNPFQDDEPVPAPPKRSTVERVTGERATVGDQPTPEELATPPKTPDVRRGEGDDKLVINIPDRPLREVLDLLSAQGHLNILAMKSVTGNVSANMNGVDVHTALDAILKSTGYLARRDGHFIYVGTPGDFKEMDSTQDRVLTRVYRPNYVSAKELQSLVAPMLSESVGRATVGAGKAAVSSPASKGVAADAAAAGGFDFAGQDVLVVIDYEQVLRQIDQVVIEVDSRPRQVAIEAMIVSVRLSDQNKLGVNFELLLDQKNARLISGVPFSPKNKVPTSLADIKLESGGLKFGFLDGSLSTFIEALETIGDTNVVASPGVMCLNKQRAEIQIGQQLGYVSTTVTENAATQAVQFLEVGTVLRIRPFISDDGMVRMEIHPELSTGNVTVQAGLTLPNKEVTQVTSNIMCHDGSTVVIGGLIREDLGQNSAQIPILGNLPWIGAAFRTRTETTARNEVIILITPRVVREPVLNEQGKNAQADYVRRQEIYADKMSPLGKRYYGRQYLRKAQAAWNAGDGETAVRFVNLAVHIDPQNMQATNLREEIIRTVGEGDNSIHAHLKVGLPPWQHPHHEYSKQGAPWVRPGERPPEIHVEPVDVIDEGSPGRSLTIDPAAPAAPPLWPSTAKRQSTPTK